MTIGEATERRREMLRRAKRWAIIAGNETLRWGVRYEAAVRGDHALDRARDYDRAILRHLQES